MQDTSDKVSVFYIETIKTKATSNDTKNYSCSLFKF